MAENPKVYGTREEILAAEDINVEDLFIDEWGFFIRIRALSARQVERAQERLRGKGIRGATAILVALAVVDGDGKPMFKESDITSLSGKAFAPMNRILRAIERMNALSQHEVEALAKNSNGGPGEDLLSD